MALRDIFREDALEVVVETTWGVRKKARQVFLFNDSLLWTSPAPDYTYKGHLLLAKSRVYEAPVQVGLCRPTQLRGRSHTAPYFPQQTECGFV